MVDRRSIVEAMWTKHETPPRSPAGANSGRLGITTDSPTTAGRYLADDNGEP